MINFFVVSAAPYKYKGWEYTGMDQDEEEEDLAAAFEEEEAEDEEREGFDAFGGDKRKPFGETRHYCPVMLKEKGVLWPGTPEIGGKYREKVYFFSSPEARTKFLENPEEYLQKDEPLQVSCSRGVANVIHLIVIPPTKKLELDFVSVSLKR